MSAARYTAAPVKVVSVQRGSIGDFITIKIEFIRQEIHKTWGQTGQPSIYDEARTPAMQ